VPAAPGSRFDGLPVLSTIAPDGSVRRVIALRLRRATLPVIARHRVLHGEAVDLLARRFFRDEDLWWRILDANQKVIHPLDVDAGLVLDIPGSGEAARVSRARSF
jgi:hypothetical protein